MNKSELVDRVPKGGTPPPKRDPDRVALEDKHGQTWTTSELQQDFDVMSFSYGTTTVRRKSDGQRGSLQFHNAPRTRYYYGFRSEG